MRGPCCARMRFDPSRAIIVADGKLHIFSIYSGFGAYKRIRSAVNAITKLAGHRWRCSSEMWKFDLLRACQPMREMARRDGPGADILIVATGSLEQRGSDLIEWLDALAPLPPARFGLLIGLLGDEDNESTELDWTARQLIRCAEKMHRKFLWNWVGYHDVDDAEWLAGGVEKLLALKQSARTELVFETTTVVS